MCGRFTTLASDELRAVVDAIEKRTPCCLSRAGDSRAQAFPGSMVSTIRLEQGTAATERLSWGFPAEWRETTVFNTRIESALGGSAMWRDAFRNGRRIIPAATFFEPHETEKALSPRTGKLVKRPYEFASEDGLPLLMAGIADERFCSVVTTEPDSRVSPVHPRMPLLLRFEEVPLWLEGGVSDIAALASRPHCDLIARPELEAAPAARLNPGAEQLSLF